MNERVGIIAALLALAALLSSSAAIAQRAQSTPKAAGSISQSENSTPKGASSISQSDNDYPYRLFETANIWTFILLDTATGLAWQVQFSLDDTGGTVPINRSSLLPEKATLKNGRFTLQPTKNMYNFLLLDREDSRIWQLQWSPEARNRGIIPLDR